jgi:hypothetical protein
MSLTYYEHIRHHSFSVEGKISYVTGAGSGFGQRIAVGLAEAVRYSQQTGLISGFSQTFAMGTLATIVDSRCTSWIFLCACLSLLFWQF